MGNVDHYANLANTYGGGLGGDALKFNRGRWFSSAFGAETNRDRNHLVARMDTLACGWRKWVDRRIVDARIGLIAEGFVPPARHELGDNDQKEWPVNAKGEPTDPWSFNFFLQLQDTKNPDTKFVWSPSSSGGKKAIAYLSKRYSEKRKTSPDALPIVELNSDHYPHKTYGRIDYPQLDVVAWINDESADKPGKLKGKTAAQAVDNDMNDSIPF
jgi:hypothetical protein